MNPIGFLIDRLAAALHRKRKDEEQQQQLQTDNRQVFNQNDFDVAKTKKTIQPEDLKDVRVSSEDLSKAINQEQPKSFIDNIGQKVNDVLDTRFTDKGKTLREVGTDFVQNPKKYSLIHQMAEGNVKSGIAPVDAINETATSYAANRMIDPATQIPQNLQTAANSNLPAKERLIGAMGVAGGVLAPIPDPTDIGFGMYNFAKGSTKAHEEGKTGMDALKTAVDSVTGKKDVSLGEVAAPNNPSAQGAINLAEIPLTILGTHKISKSLKGGVKSESEAFINALASEKDTAKQDIKALGNEEITPMGSGGSMPPTKPPAQSPVDLAPNIKIDERGKIVKTNDPNKYEFDLKSLNTEDDVKKTIEGIAQTNNPAIQEARRGTMTYEDTRKLADSLGMTVEDVQRRAPGKVFNAEQADAAGRLALSAQEELRNVTSKVKELQDAGQEIPQALQLQQMEAAARAVGVTSSIIGNRSETARALNAAKMLKEAMDNPTSQASEKAIKFFAGDPKKAADVLKKLSTFEPDDSLGMMKFLRQVKPSTAMDKISEFWYNSILSNTATHIVNQTGNMMSTILKPAESVVAGVLDKTLETGAKAIGKDYQRTRYVHEAAAQLNGLNSGFADGFRRAWYVMKNGVSEADTSKFDLGRGQAIKGKAGAVINTPSRLLVAGDELWKGVNYQMDIWGQAMRAARQEGKTGEDLSKRVAELVANPSAQMMTKATKTAKYRLFQGDSRSADAVAKFRDNVMVLDLGKFGGEFKPLQFIIPFVQTPTNVLKFGLERSPVGLAATAYKALKGAPKEEVIDQAAKAFIGSSVMVPLAIYATQDRITGAAPTDRKESDAFYADGKMPWSIKIGDRWVAYNRVEPFNTILSQIAMWHDAEKKNAGKLNVETIADFAKGMARNMGDQTFMTGLGNLMDAVQDPERYGSKFITDIIGGFIPSLAAAGARAGDETVRKPEDFVDSLQARIPGQTQNVPGMPSDFEPGGVAKRHNQDNLASNIASNFLGFRTSPDQGTNLQKGVQDIKAINKVSKEQSQKEKDTATQIISELKGQSPQQKKEILKKYQESGELTKDVEKKIIEQIKQSAIPLVSEDRILKGANNEVKAAYLYKKISGWSKEDRQAYLSDLASKKLITADTLVQYARLKKQEETGQNPDLLQATQ